MQLNVIFICSCLNFFLPNNKNFEEETKQSKKVILILKSYIEKKEKLNLKHETPNNLINF
jgi:hypothetical protein